MTHIRTGATNLYYTEESDWLICEIVEERKEKKHLEHGLPSIPYFYHLAKLEHCPKYQSKVRLENVLTS